ncbi:hypothetical protein AVEN_226278-1 [Araneus ventricosus]|uniref:Uncharacterized protein n=1 Tax=Araneus ventricosus TaxID=182803 RepID=A0A4Y2D905_ARAVE|nr:hypothetical protein AVEN_226278-1 [Araneus ventricosus]
MQIIVLVLAKIYRIKIISWGLPLTPRRCISCWILSKSTNLMAELPAEFKSCGPLCTARQPEARTNPGLSFPGCIFTNPTLIELRQEIGQYDWLASPRADDVVLCSRACTFH